MKTQQAIDKSVEMGTNVFAAVGNNDNILNYFYCQTIEQASAKVAFNYGEFAPFVRLVQLTGRDIISTGKLTIIN